MMDIYKILAVDDIPENLSTIVDALSEIGMTDVLTAPNGKVAFELCKKYQPDLILTDWEMPVMNGIELTKKVKNDPETSSIPIIMITAVMINPDQMKESFDAGVQDYLRKPFNYQEFHARVINTLSLSSTQKSLNTALEDLESLNNAKSKFFTNIVHDLKTPISIIIGQTQILLEDESEYLSKATLDKLNGIIEYGKKLDTLSSEMREIIKLEEGKLKLNRGYIQASEYIDRLVQLFSVPAKSKGIDIQYEPGNTDSWLHIDGIQFDKVMFNLLSNAIEYTPTSGHIKIELTVQENQTIVSIQDNGPGIPEDVLPRLFERYSHDGGVNRGLGIGMSIAKEIVHLHGGEIAVSSSDKGTTFDISIPSKDLVAENERTIAVNDHLNESVDTLKSQNHFKHNTTPQTESAGTVLLVDDNSDIRDMIKSMLGGEFTIIEASDGEEALRQLKLYRIDAIITDYLMPVMDGLAFINSIKKDPTLSNIPCMLFSSRMDEEIKLKGLETGVSSFLSKPFNPTEFKLTLKNLLEKSSNAGVPSVFNKYDKDAASRELIEKLEKLVYENMDNVRFGIYDLANEIAVSERKLFRIIKYTLDITPKEFIKKIRFDFIKSIIEQGKVHSLTEASKAIAMPNVTNFKNQYLERFGQLPELNKS